MSALVKTASTAFLLGLSIFSPTVLAAPSRRGLTQFPPHDDTVSTCTWFVDYDGSETCADIVKDNFITLEDLMKWNPSVKAGCTGLVTGYSYCVEALDVPGPTPTSTSSSSTSTSTSTSSTAQPSPTQPSNGIATPLPTQPGMVDNCDAFYFVKADESCNDIATRHGITLAQFSTWNPKLGDGCGGLWAEAYVCVSVIGHTPTTGPNGIYTPTPRQPNMVANCDGFDLLATDKVGCSYTSWKNFITTKQLELWNGADCFSLVKGHYTCVSIIGHSGTTPYPSIVTPTPFQDEMTRWCKAFHLVKPNETCDDITKKYNIPFTDFVTWNPAVGLGCNSMWSNAYVCVNAYIDICAGGRC